MWHHTAMHTHEQYIAMEAALGFAREMHEGQTRKDGKTPYIVHPEEVAFAVYDHAPQYWSTETISILVQSAYLHDVIEDCFSEERSQLDLRLTIGNRFGSIVEAIVWDLTDDESSEAGHNRRERKFTRTEELAGKGRLVRFLKLLDRLCNVRTMSCFKEGFRYKYAMETIELGRALLWKEPVGSFMYDIFELMVYESEPYLHRRITL